MCLWVCVCLCVRVCFLSLFWTLSKVWGCEWLPALIMTEKGVVFLHLCVITTVCVRVHSSILAWLCCTLLITTVCIKGSRESDISVPFKLICRGKNHRDIFVYTATQTHPYYSNSVGRWAKSPGRAVNSEVDLSTKHFGEAARRRRWRKWCRRRWQRRHTGRWTVKSSNRGLFLLKVYLSVSLGSRPSWLTLSWPESKGEKKIKNTSISNLGKLKSKTLEEEREGGWSVREGEV